MRVLNLSRKLSPDAIEGHSSAILLIIKELTYIRIARRNMLNCTVHIAHIRSPLPVRSSRRSKSMIHLSRLRSSGSVAVVSNKLKCKQVWFKEVLSKKKDTHYLEGKIIYKYKGAYAQVIVRPVAYILTPKLYNRGSTLCTIAYNVMIYKTPPMTNLRYSWPAIQSSLLARVFVTPLYVATNRWPTLTCATPNLTLKDSRARCS